MQLVGFFTCLIAIWLLFGESVGQRIVAFLLLLFGVLVFAVARILAWWFHG